MASMSLLNSLNAWGVNICFLSGKIWSIVCIGGSLVARGSMIMRRKCAIYCRMLRSKRIGWYLLRRLLGRILGLMCSMTHGLRIIGSRVIDWLIKSCMLAELLARVWTSFFMLSWAPVDCLKPFRIWWGDGWLLIKTRMYLIEDLIYMGILCSREYSNYWEALCYIRL